MYILNDLRDIKVYLRDRQFLLAINSVKKNIFPPIQSSLYENYFNIVCKSKSLTTIQIKLQQAISNLTKWTNTSGSSFLWKNPNVFSLQGNACPTP